MNQLEYKDDPWADKPKKKQPKARDPNLAHPAVKAHKQVTQRTVAPLVRAEIARRVGKLPERVLAWRKHVKWWIMKGYNPMNVEGMLDSFSHDSNGQGEDAAADVEKWREEHGLK